MLDYQDDPCVSCGEITVIYHQYIGDACCESCGEWQESLDKIENAKETHNEL